MISKTIGFRGTLFSDKPTYEIPWIGLRDNLQESPMILME